MLAEEVGTLLGEALSPDTRARKRKWRPPTHRAEGDAVDKELTRATADLMLLGFKAYSSEDVDALRTRLRTRAADTSSRGEPASLLVRVVRNPVYLLGRYLKLSRDVPQSQWTISSGADAGVRRGRASVEEIISEAVVCVLQAARCSMHACGREDIDVRMLGNGRPFALEVFEPKSAVNASHLFALVEHIRSRSGLNGEGDVEVPHMEMSTAATWSRMQAVAEEKRKGYRCVVWCSGGVRDETLQQLVRELACRDQDDCSRACLRIAQLTPLRVLHRRSLLNRPRFVYDLRATLINSHFFTLDLVTSAGTYVKEFVHGDLGRTEPSIAGALGCMCDILQLDVVKLFDEFAGGISDDVTGVQP